MDFEEAIAEFASRPDEFIVERNSGLNGHVFSPLKQIPFSLVGGWPFWYCHATLISGERIERLYLYPAFLETGSGIEHCWHMPPKPQSKGARTTSTPRWTYSSKSLLQAVSPFVEPSCLVSIQPATRSVLLPIINGSDMLGGELYMGFEFSCCLLRLDDGDVVGLAHTGHFIDGADFSANSIETLDWERVVGIEEAKREHYDSGSGIRWYYLDEPKGLRFCAI